LAISTLDASGIGPLEIDVAATTVASADVVDVLAVIVEVADEDEFAEAVTTNEVGEVAKWDELDDDIEVEDADVVLLAAVCGSRNAYPATDMTRITITAIEATALPIAFFRSIHHLRVLPECALYTLATFLLALSVGSAHPERVWRHEESR
jgi:hypothetical protein